MDATKRRRDPVLLTIAVVVLAVVVIAVIAVLVRDDRVALDPESPEGTVQQFTRAMIDRDRAEARALVDDAALDGCQYESGYFPERELRVTLAGTHISGDTATVSVSITSGDGGIFGSSYQDRSEFTLTGSGDGWRVTSAPWQFDVCTLESVR